MPQELIANMLGVCREGVTEAAGKLQRVGLIENHRGHINVLDRPGLDACADRNTNYRCSPLDPEEKLLLKPRAPIFRRRRKACGRRVRQSRPSHHHESGRAPCSRPCLTTSQMVFGKPSWPSGFMTTVAIASMPAPCWSATTQLDGCVGSVAPSALAGCDVTEQRPRAPLAHANRSFEDRCQPKRNMRKFKNGMCATVQTTAAVPLKAKQ